MTQRPFQPNQLEVHGFLQDQSHMHGVLTYLGMDGWPDTAFVAFSATPKLEIIFGTSRDSHKYSLLWNDRRVGFNVTDRDRRYTVQLKGLAAELSRSEMDNLESSHYGKLGEASKRFRDLPDQRFFIIVPSWLRFTDCVDEPWTMTTLMGVRTKKALKN